MKNFSNIFNRIRIVKYVQKYFMFLNSFTSERKIGLILSEYLSSGFNRMVTI